VPKGSALFSSDSAEGGWSKASQRIFCTFTMMPQRGFVNHI
jgi:hypothetical protein